MHRIREVKEQGRIVILTDGSKWEVSSFDAFHTRLWMVMDEIKVELGSLTNLSRQNRKVNAIRKTGG